MTPAFLYPRRMGFGSASSAASSRRRAGEAGLFMSLSYGYISRKIKLKNQLLAEIPFWRRTPLLNVLLDFSCRFMLQERVFRVRHCAHEAHVILANL